MTTPVGEHYRAYTPAPFTRAERETVTVLFGGLHWRVERVLQAVLENVGNRAEVLPIATREDLLTGRQVADIGQCCPTSFTTGNLVNFLRRKANEQGAEETIQRYVSSAAAPATVPGARCGGMSRRPTSRAPWRRYARSSRRSRLTACA